MRTQLVLVAIAAAIGLSVGLAVMHSDASAAGAGDPRIASLQTQVKALQLEVTHLRNQTNWLWDGANCMGAMTADLIQGTWISVDQALQKTVFGPQTQVPDYGSCGRMVNPKVPRTSPIGTPPSISELLPLLKWLSS